MPILASSSQVLWHFHTEDNEYAQGWDPLPDVGGTLISHHFNWWETAKYENGFLFYQMLDLEK